MFLRADTLSGLSALALHALGEKIRHRRFAEIRARDADQRARELHQLLVADGDVDAPAVHPRPAEQQVVHAGIIPAVSSVGSGIAASWIGGEPASVLADEKKDTPVTLEAIPIVDPHQHLWDLSKLKLPWQAVSCQLLVTSKQTCNDNHRRSIPVPQYPRLSRGGDRCLRRRTSRPPGNPEDLAGARTGKERDFCCDDLLASPAKGNLAG